MTPNEDQLADHIVSALVRHQNAMSPSGSPSASNMYTIPQILSVLGGLFVIVGGFVGTWVTLQNDITRQRVSSEIELAQLQKESGEQKADLDALKQQLDTMRSTVAELYSTRAPK